LTVATEPLLQGAMPVPSARAWMIAAVAPLAATDRVPLADALGRVLAAAVVSDVDVPSADNAAMDGFAFRWADFEAAGRTLPVAGRVAAGDVPRALTPGIATRIFTGAPVPEGADTVVRVEETDVADGRLHLTSGAKARAGANVRRAGGDVARGSVALAAGRRLSPFDLGVAASVGVDRLTVVRKPRVAVVATGDELTEPGAPLPAGGLYDGNGPLLRALLERAGADVVHVGRAADDLDATIVALRAAAEGADLLISSGGVSVGDEDHVKPAVRALGAVDLWGIDMKPGRPVAFGRVAGVPWLGLPGNPAAGSIAFLLFGVPLLRRLVGRSDPFPEPWMLPAGFERTQTQRREEWLRVRREDGRAVPAARQGSGVLSSMAASDALARVPAGATLAAGDPIDVFPFDELLW
jgi:molybdopterin molybdotransferase